jgi:hypothetical protein
MIKNSAIAKKKYTLLAQIKLRINQAVAVESTQRITVDKSGCGCRKYTANSGLVPRAGWCKKRWRNNRNRQQWVADPVYSSTPKLLWTSLLSSFNIHDVSGAGSIPATMNLFGTLKATSKTAMSKITKIK